MLCDEERTWPKTLRLRGCTYNDLVASSGDLSVRHRLRWVKLDRSYSPQIYEELRAYYVRVGRVEEAREVAVAKYRRRETSLHGLAKLGSRCLDWTIRYGYRPGRAVAILIAVILASAGVFSWAAHHGKMTELKNPGNPPEYRSWVYALDAVLPVINLNQETSWAPRGLIAQGAYVLGAVLGWVLVAVILATLTARFVRD